jgi:hypothetical protein
LASHFPEFGRQFGTSLSRVLAIQDPKAMLLEWREMRTQIGSFVFESACAMGNVEQQSLIPVIGDAHVRWSAHLDYDELLRFANVCSACQDLAPDLPGLDAGFVEPAHARQNATSRNDDRHLPSHYLPRSGLE